MGFADDIINRNKKKTGFADRVIQNKGNEPLFGENHMQSTNRLDSALNLPTREKSYYDNLKKGLKEKDLKRYEAKNRGTKHLRENTGVNPNIFLKKDRRNQSTPLEKTNRDVIKENMKTEDYRLANNDYVMDKYEINKHDVENDKIGFGDKVYDTLLAGGISLLDTSENKYVDDNGKITYLPSKQDMKHAKIQESFGDNIIGKTEKFINNVGYEGSKILASKAIDALSVGVPVGSGLYYKKILNDSYEEAVNQGYEHNKAFMYATSVGSLDYVLDKITGGVTIGGNKLLSKIGKKGGFKTLDNAVFDGLTKIGIKPNVSKIISKGVAEGGQEFIEEFLENTSKLTFLDNSTNLKDYADVFKDPDVWSAALYAGAVGFVLGSGSGAMEGGSIDVFNNELDKIKQTKSLKERQEIEKLQSEINNNQTQQETVENIVEKPSIQETMVSDIVKKDPLTTKFQYETTENTKINELNESMSKYFNNSEKTKQLSDTISKIIEDKEFKVVFDDGIVNKVGKSVNAKIIKDNGNVEIRINPNNPRAVEFLMVHEITHAIETQDMIDLVDDFAKKNEGFNEALESLKETYGTNDVSDEVLADISGQLFGNQEFINSLSMDKPNIFKRIYNKIVELANKITGNSNEALFIKDLKQKWENAYRNVNNNVSKMEKNSFSEDISDNIQTLEEHRKRMDEIAERLQKENNKDWVYYANESLKTEELINKAISKENNEQYSQKNGKWQEHLEKNYKATGTRTFIKDIKETPTETPKILPTTSKTLNPIEISNLTKEDVSSTPKLPTIKVKTGEGKSKFAKNIETKTNMLTKESKQNILSSDEVTTYEKTTNKGDMEKAKTKLDKGGKNEVINWLAKDTKKATSTDVAEGWILLKRYQDEAIKAKDAVTKDEMNRAMVQVAKKMRATGTSAGQTVQAFNIMNRLTPEGMVYYAQSELDEAFDIMKKNKTKEWIDENSKNFELTPEETQFIMNNVEEASKLPENSYEKKVKLAEIQKVMTDKLPPQKGAGIKAWMRISMLFNPKTQVRNVLGNAVILPVNVVGDKFSSMVDKQIAKITGVRTKGSSLKGYGHEWVKGVDQSISEGKKGISTRDIEGNKFEIGEGKSFNDNTKVGKALNRVDNILSTMLDAGDRGFYNATFETSLRNQMVLNHTTEVTPEMIAIATNEALSRTWQDNNNYTKFVLNVRKMLNGNKAYGVGDILIPFAKTPANLTKAIVDYSPVGLVSSIKKGINLKRSLNNGQFTPQLQHEFVDSLGKATVGTMLYVLGTALAQAGITTGDNDKDKDVSNFMRNILGKNSYSIKIGGKSYSYSWAQPLAAPLSITANIVSKKNEDANFLEKTISSLNIAGDILLEQSFMDSINTVLNNRDGFFTGLEEAILDLPARTIPTLFKQIADIVDPQQRTSFEYDKPLKTLLNKIKSKLPIASKELTTSYDTLGRPIMKYGGKNNLFNVFLNPANIATENISKSGEEIYRLYKETGDKTIMPRVAPYYINQKGEKITLSTKQKSEFQKISGGIIESEVDKLMNSSIYKDSTDEEKAAYIKEIVDYSYNVAREEIVKIPMSQSYKKINQYVRDGGSPSDYYTHKEEINYAYENPTRYATIRQITTYNKYTSYKKELDGIRDNTENKKEATIKYINGLNLSIPKKAMLIKTYYKSFKNYDKQIIKYINSQDISIEEKTAILKDLGFDVRNGRVY